jgi:hypothetical protein
VYTAPVPPPLTRILSVLAVWAAAAVLLGWGHLPGPWRRGLAVLASALGLLCLILAVNTEGLRESPTMAAFLLGAPSVTQSASASASLPYYVLTGILLLLGTLGLAVPDETARRLARRRLATAIALSLGVTLLRFTLEKVAAPATWTYPAGIVWLGPAVGAYLALGLRDAGRGPGALLRDLAAYALAARGFVALLAVLATLLRAGTHYDVSPVTVVRLPFGHDLYQFAPGGLWQIVFIAVLPQLLFWPLFTLVTGLLGAGLVMLVRHRPADRTEKGGAAAGEARARPLEPPLAQRE